MFRSRLLLVLIMVSCLLHMRKAPLGTTLFVIPPEKNRSFQGGYVLYPVLKFLLHSEENDDAFATF